MITFSDAVTVAPYFRDVCKKSVGLLRFCSITNIVNIKSSCNGMRAEILANISQLSAKLKLFTDIIIKEQEQELFPVLESVLSKIASQNTLSDKCIKAASPIKSRVESAVRRKISTEDSGIIIDDYKAEIKRYSKEALFRDAEYAYDIFNTIFSSVPEQVELPKETAHLKNLAVRFTAKHYNTALDLKNDVENLIAKYNEFITILDACDVALELNSLYNDNEKLMVFLDSDMEKIILTIKNIYTEKLKS